MAGFDWRRSTLARLLQRRGASDIDDKYERTDEAAQWLARNGGPPLPKAKEKIARNWKRIRKRKKERREREGKPLKARGRREKAMLPRGTVVVGLGPPCPRCKNLMQVREHAVITEKQLKKPYYYSRWHCCSTTNCRTKLVMPEKFRVYTENQVLWGDSWDETDKVLNEVSS